MGLREHVVCYHRLFLLAAMDEMPYMSMHTRSVFRYYFAEVGMKRKILLGNLLLVTVALISIVMLPSATGQANAGKAGDRHLITVLNPAISTKMAERVPLGPRMKTVEGQTLYLVDMQWGGPDAGHSVFEEMQGWFSQHMPSVKVVIRRMKTGPFGDDPGLRKEIIDNKVGGVVIGIAG
jgi:hypothetical protein